MYLWNIEKLKANLISNNISQRDLLYYLLIDTILTYGSIEAGAFMPLEIFNLWDIFNSILGILITVFGTFWVYKSNGGDIGTKFLEKYLTIGFVTLMRYAFLLIPVLYAIYFLDEDSANETKWWHVIIIKILYIGYFWRFAKHIREVANAK